MNLSALDGIAADGTIRSWTSYGADGPIATVNPLKRKLRNPRLDQRTKIRYSRFAYLRRNGHTMLLQTPLGGADMELHHPCAGAMLAALSFDMDAEQLSSLANVPVDVAQEFINQLVAMSAAFPVAHERDHAAALYALGELALEHGLPGTWQTDELQAALYALPWERIGDPANLILELHHDGSRRVDISMGIEAAQDRHVLTPFRFEEFDVLAEGPTFMGTFDGVRPVPVGTDPQDWTQRALDEAARDFGEGSTVRVGGNPNLVRLITALGGPAFLGMMVRRPGVRIIFNVSTREHLVAIAEILTESGLPASVAERLAFLEPLLNNSVPLRLAVDVFGDRILPRAAWEIFLDDQVQHVVPGVLDALGVDTQVLDEILSIVQQNPRLRDLMLAPGVVTDEQALGPLHVKVAFDADGEVEAKTYITVTNQPLSSAGRTEEDRLVPSSWEFHDLLFHSQTREGRVRHRLGGTNRFDLAAPEMQTKLPPAAGDVLLPAIDVAAAVQGDPPFGVVMRERESIRDWSGPEIPVDALAELLARVQEILAATADYTGEELPWTHAPYPSGGGVYETDIVVIAHRVRGLAPGAYLYRRASGSLQPLTGGSPEKLLELMMGAAMACGVGITQPQALLIFAARFPDLAVKYEGVAYSLMLKHVGVLMATVAYAATAMGLGSVPLGTGNSDQFAAATGLDYYRHGSIGEIAITVPPMADM